ncbi:MAG: 2-hydroxychromene-2-carboxylate isomerase [Myxococcota bacterium]|nr:2-hydroxychromene-2-carboxylate isomerase [Myxococcota bacterium]
MSVDVEFHFDFGSPNAYLSHKVIPGIEKRTGVRFAYVPVLLGGVFKATGNASPAVTLQGIKNKPQYQQIEMQRFLERHDLVESFRFNPHFPVNTLQIMRGAIAAQRSSPELYARYVDAVYRAMWQEPAKLDDPDVIRATLEAAGLPADELIAGMQDPEVKAQLIANTEDSVSRGVFGSPSFFVGSELFFGKDRLREVEEEIRAQQEADAG